MQRLRTPETKLFYFLVLLARKNGFAFPTNEYLASKYGVCVRTIQRYLRKLEKFGMIETKTVLIGKFEHRHIYITENGHNMTENTSFFKSCHPLYLNLYCYNKYYINNKKYNIKTIVFKSVLNLPLCNGKSLCITEEFIKSAQKVHVCNIKAELFKVLSWFKRFPRIRMSVKRLFLFLQDWFLRNDKRIAEQKNASGNSVCVLPMCHGRTMPVTSEMIDKWKEKHNCNVLTELKNIVEWLEKHTQIRMKRNTLLEFIDKWFSSHDFVLPYWMTEEHQAEQQKRFEQFDQEMHKGRIAYLTFKTLRAMRRGNKGLRIPNIKYRLIDVPKRIATLKPCRILT